jgi:Rrf2 family protein
MKISAKAQYACLAIMALARHQPDQTPVRIRTIAEAHGIPERYLVQILLQLKGAGLVYSTRGAAGGYRLARPADQISLGEVLTAIDGPGEPPSGPCWTGPRSPSWPRGPRPSIGSSEPSRPGPPIAFDSIRSPSVRSSTYHVSSTRTQS